MKEIMSDNEIDRPISRRQTSIRPTTMCIGQISSARTLHPMCRFGWYLWKSVCPSSSPRRSGGTFTIGSVGRNSGPRRLSFVRNGRFACPGRWFICSLIRSGADTSSRCCNQGGTVSTATGQRTYFISQMGKYVPGKVFVIVIRVAMLGKNIGISRTAVGIASFYESVVWAGSGAVIGILLLPPSLWDGLRDEFRSRGGELPDLHRIWLVLPMAARPIGLVGLSRFVNRVLRWRKGRDAAQLPRVKLHWSSVCCGIRSAGWSWA